MPRKSSITLKVAEARQRDVGRQKACIDGLSMQQINVTTGDIVEIAGEKSIGAIVWPAYPEDQNAGLIRLDNVLRRNAGVSLGDEIKTSKADVKNGKVVTLTPFRKPVNNGPSFQNFVKRKLLGYPLIEEELILIPVLGRSRPFKVTSTLPKGIIRITEDTQIIVSDTPILITGSDLLRAFYEDTIDSGEQIQRIRKVEELAINAWPAHQTLLYDGWVLRFADGFTRRANSISPLYPSTLPLKQKLDFCRTLYTSKGLPVIFKLTSKVFPKNLDEVLAQEDYKKEAPTSVQILSSFQQFSIEPSEEISLFESLTNRWLKSFAQFQKRIKENLSSFRKILQALPFPHCFILYSQKEDVGFGLGVVQGNWLGIFNIFVHEKYRRRGIGKQLTLHLINWGEKYGATKAYLQVMEENVPALTLYNKLGFQELYYYWYRVKEIRNEKIKA
ncbi:MAG: GNAT family N-acetyltransferase [Candidatus Heimdallarchaeota archaeon]|nr:GNAT family N-acetyltransferase [Candidatus Heimdallarchaeota archaeon]